MESNLSLNSIHNDLVSDFLRLSRYQLVQRLKSVNHCFGSILTYRVREDETYTSDEVRNMLCDLQEMVHTEVETELSDCVHTNVLLVHQLLTQAEEWHLTLSANISELENREKLNAVKQYDENLRKEPERMSVSVTRGKDNIPFEDMNVASALKKEVIRLTAENDILRSRISLIETKIEVEHDDKSPSKMKSSEDLVMELSQAHEQIEWLQSSLNAKEAADNDQITSIHSTVDKITHELSLSRQAAATESEELRQQLENRESKLRQVQSNLLLAEKELEKKFQATGAYANMKKMLVQKNNQIRTLRTKLVALGAEHNDQVDDVDGSNLINEDEET